MGIKIKMEDDICFESLKKIYERTFTDYTQSMQIYENNQEFEKNADNWITFTAEDIKFRS